MENISKDDFRYKEAERQVKRIKRFYVFVFIYIVVNIFIFLINYRELKPGQTIWQLKYFLLPLVWGSWGCRFCNENFYSWVYVRKQLGREEN